MRFAKYFDKSTWAKITNLGDNFYFAVFVSKTDMADFRINQLGIPCYFADIVDFTNLATLPSFADLNNS